MRKYLCLLGLISTVASLSLFLFACRDSNSSADPACTTSSASSPASSSGLGTVREDHVFIVLEENHSVADVIGNASMPYLNRLATTYSYAQGYYADTHPSIGNYLMLTTGQIITNDDTSSAEISVDNIVRHLISAGKTWKEYSENLPHVGYTGGDANGYTEHHNPLSYLSDVRGSSAEAQNLVPFTQLAIDLARQDLPNYAFIVPDNNDDAHDGTLAQADSWLQQNIDPLIQSSEFNRPGAGLLIITFDESEDSDTAGGGGHVAWVVVGADVKKGYVSSTCYKHENTLRFMAKTLGLTDFPGAAESAADMDEFLSGN